MWNKPWVTGHLLWRCIATPPPNSLSSHLASPSPMWILTLLGWGWMNTILSYSHGMPWGWWIDTSDSYSTHQYDHFATGQCCNCRSARPLHQQNVFLSLEAIKSVWENVECKLRCVNFRRVSDPRRALLPDFRVTGSANDKPGSTWERQRETWECQRPVWHHLESQ